MIWEAFVQALLNFGSAELWLVMMSGVFIGAFGVLQLPAGLFSSSMVAPSSGLAVSCKNQPNQIRGHQPRLKCAKDLLRYRSAGLAEATNQFVLSGPRDRDSGNTSLPRC